MPLRRRSTVVALATVALAVSLGVEACSSSEAPPGAASAGAGGGSATGGGGVAGGQGGDAGSSASGTAGAPSGGGTGGSTGGTGGLADVSPPEWNKNVTPLPDADAAAQRAACAFKAGALPAESLGDQAPLGSKIPIDHVVLVMMENRSFDHFFQKIGALGRTDVDVAPDAFSNKKGSGDVPIHPIADGPYCQADLEHGWAAVHQEVAGGKMTGFAMANEVSGDGARAMTYQTPDSMPFGYYLAQNFAIGDRYFCSLQGPTWPNRMYFYAATSFGVTSNAIPKVDNGVTIFDNLATRGVDWRVYRSSTPGAGMFVHLLLDYKTRFKPESQFFTDAAAGTLPPVSFIDPDLLGQHQASATSQHPPANHEYGEQFLYDIVQAVMTSPAWSRTALFITYDEHGGYYDHVPPPKACEPDATPPADGADLGKFDELGVRVPVYVVSPYAKKQFVSHAVHDHTSIVRFIESRFTLPALTARDANADAMTDFFDFESPPFMTPPTLPERPGITAGKDAECNQLFP